MRLWLLLLLCCGLNWAVWAQPKAVQPAVSTDVAVDSLYLRYRTLVPIPASTLPVAQRAKALQTIVAFLQQHPNYTLGYTEQALLALQTERTTLLQQSLTHLERLKVPAQPAVYLSGAQIAHAQKRYPLALKLLQQAQKQHGPTDALLLQQAAVYQALNNATDALKALQQAKQLAPKNPAVLHALAQNYQSSNPRQSAALYEQLLSYTDYRPAALVALGGLHWQLYQADPGPNNRPNLKKAAEYYRQYGQLRPKDDTLPQLLAHLDVLLKEGS